MGSTRDCDASQWSTYVCVDPLLPNVFFSFFIAAQQKSHIKVETVEASGNKLIFNCLLYKKNLSRNGTNLLPFSFLFSFALFTFCQGNHTAF